jgi:hypothetical protein
VHIFCKIIYFGNLLKLMKMISMFLSFDFVKIP